MSVTVTSFGVFFDLFNFMFCLVYHPPSPVCVHQQATAPDSFSFFFSFLLQGMNGGFFLFFLIVFFKHTLELKVFVCKNL